MLCLEPEGSLSIRVCGRRFDLNAAVYVPRELRAAGGEIDRGEPRRVRLVKLDEEKAFRKRTGSSSSLRCNYPPATAASDGSAAINAAINAAVGSLDSPTSEPLAVYYESRLLKDLRGFPNCRVPVWFPLLCGRYLRQPEFTLTVIGYADGFPQIVVYGEETGDLGALLATATSTPATSTPATSTPATSTPPPNVQRFRYWRTPQLQRAHSVHVHRELLRGHRRALIESGPPHDARLGPASTLMYRVRRAFATPAPERTVEILTKTAALSARHMAGVRDVRSETLTVLEVNEIDFSTPASCLRTLRIPQPPRLPITVCNTPATAVQQHSPATTTTTTPGRLEARILRDITVLLDRGVVDFDRAPFQRRARAHDRIADARVLVNAGFVH